MKPNGISVLLSAQNEERLLRDCVESFLSFGDELIVVSNGSTDRTVEIGQELQEQYPEKVQFFNAPALPDLYHNRALALEKARFRWVMRGDADYVAYDDEDGQLSIANLRKRILGTVPIWPTAFFLRQVNLSYRLNMTRKPVARTPISKYIAPTLDQAMPRIYLNTNLLKFKRLGRSEGVPHMRFYRKVTIEQPFWFHCTLKQPQDLFFRSERTNWRELGDYSTYPSLRHYIELRVLPEKYPNLSMEEAIEDYLARGIMPFLQAYDPDQYYPYPHRLRRLMQRKPQYTDS